MVDIHSHVVYGVDDGARTIDDSIAMLELAAAAGTTDIVATPHSDLKYQYDSELVRERIAELQQRMGDKIRIHKGCDFHLFFDNIENCKADRSQFTINGKRYLMVEFADHAIVNGIERVFRDMLADGITPVITHPERNSLLMGRVGEMVQWVREGCLIQVTAQSFTGRFGKSAEGAAHRLMRHSMVHFIASDAHDTEWRPPDMREPYKAVASRYGEYVAEKLFTINPRMTLTGQYVDFEYPDEEVKRGKPLWKFW